MGNFEQHIKNALEDYSVEYNPTHWKSVEKNLPKKSKSKSVIVKSLSLAAVVVAGIAAWYFYTQEEQNTLPKQTEAPSDSSIIIDHSEKEIETTSSQIKDEPKVETVVKEKDVVKPEVAKGIKSKKSLPQDMVDVSSQDQPVAIQSKGTTLEKKQTENITPEKRDVENTIFVEIKADRKVACANTGISFFSTVNEPSTYRWNFGDGTSSNLPNPVHSYVKPGSYGVSLEVTSIITGISKRVLAGKSFTIHPQPEATFEVEMGEPKDFEQILIFENTTEEFLKTEWIIDNESYFTHELSHPFSIKGEFPVSMVTQNEFGCYDTVMQEISINEEYSLLAANAFTPNDDGQNDVFIPTDLRNTKAKFDFHIINPTTGKVIFTSKTAERPWDGTDVNTGEIAVSGVYGWIVNIYISPTETKTFKGSVHLLD